MEKTGTEKIIGILGGMGPLATADLFKKIIMHTKASSDSEHIRVVIDSNTKIPDRTEYIMGRGPSPVNEMIKTALRLEMMGADIIVMPCNTAHYFYDSIKEHIKAEFINMVEETAMDIIRIGGSRKTIALLATEGTCHAGVYDRIFGEKGLKLIKPGKYYQDIISSVIYDVKKGIFRNYRESIGTAVSELKKEGADLFILGCTELPVYFETLGIKENTADPTDILAKSAVARAGMEII